MDPHSRLSQFNQRTPSAGPLLPFNSRFIEPLPKRVGKSPKSRTKHSGASQNLFSPSMRPMTTNSRVDEDERYRRDMHLSFVNNALQQKSNGVSEPFDELVNQLNFKSLNDGGCPPFVQIRLWISALSHVVSRFERTHSALVEALVAFPWATMDNITVKAYIHFIGLLLSARPEYLSLVLSNIVRGFTYQSGLQSLNAGAPEGSSSPLTRRIIYDRLHMLLRHLYSLIPTLPSTLQPLLVHNFPHKRQDQVAHTTYIRNLLRVAGICPELADAILATIIERAIQIDVEIQVELEELDEDDADQNEQVFELDPFDTVLGRDEDDSDSNTDDSDENEGLSDLSSDEDEDAIDVPTNLQHIRDMVKKLDVILKLILDHLNRIQMGAHSPSNQLSSGPKSPSSATDNTRISSPAMPPVASRRSAQFDVLLSIFERTILCTFKSRYTQFLVFWYSSLDSEFSDLFQGMLVSKALLEQAQPLVRRAAAASYIASLVSRARFIERDGARRVMGVLCDFLRNHLDVLDAESRSDVVSLNATHHGVFYSIAQAVFLVFCFRWRDFLENEDEDMDEFSGDLKTPKQWMSQLSVIQRLITCPLNPLKVCSENVVMQFARVARATDFIYCYSILEHNNRMEYAANLADNARPRVHHSANEIIIDSSTISAELNTFFPFDPYKLPKSMSYIENIYREWSSVAIGGGDDDENDEDGFSEAGEDDDIKAARGRHLDIPRSDCYADDRSLAHSIDAMSISPLRPADLKMTCAKQV